MSFISLLIILSLAVIIPLFFVLRSKFQIEKDEASNISAQIEDTVPSFEDIFRYPLPEQFETILHDLAYRYRNLSQKNIPSEKAFTAKKLITVRVPELIYDYLKLDEHYAKTAIVDEVKQLTSADLVTHQLTSIQHFIQKLDDAGNSDVVNNLLANRNYLQSIYENNGLEESVVTNQRMSFQALLDETYKDDYIDYGYEYLHEFYPNQDTPIDSIVYELGRVVFLSDHAIRLTYQQLGKQVMLEYVDFILCESLPSLMDTLYELRDSASNRHQLLAARLFVQKLDDYASKIKKQLAQVTKASTEEERLAVLTQINEDAKKLINDNYFELKLD